VEDWEKNVKLLLSVDFLVSAQTLDKLSTFG
jgi:hypothetical protein